MLEALFVFLDIYLPAQNTGLCHTRPEHSYLSFNVYGLSKEMVIYLYRIVTL